MSLLQIVWNVYFAVLGAFLSIVMARVVKQNGNLLKKMDEGFGKMDEGFKLIARLIVEENEKARKEILQALAK